MSQSLDCGWLMLFLGHVPRTVHGSVAAAAASLSCVSAIFSHLSRSCWLGHEPTVHLEHEHRVSVPKLSRDELRRRARTSGAHGIAVSLVAQLVILDLGKLARSAMGIRCRPAVDTGEEQVVGRREAIGYSKYGHTHSATIRSRLCVFLPAARTSLLALSMSRPFRPMAAEAMLRILGTIGDVQPVRPTQDETIEISGQIIEF